MKHRIKKLMCIAILLVMGFGTVVQAEENASMPSVTITIPISFAPDLSSSVDVTVTIQDRESGEVLKTITRKEIANTGGNYSFPLTYTEPGNHKYTVTAVSKLGEESCYADVAVLSDDEGLSAALVMYWKDTTAKIDDIEFGHWKNDVVPTQPDVPTQPGQPTPDHPTPGQPTPDHPTSSNQILGVESHSWYLPLLVMAAGIIVAVIAVVCKRMARERS